MPQVIRVEANLHWKVARTASEEWVGVCDPLKLTVSAPTFKELMESIDETLRLVFLDLLDSGELDQFMRANGWRRLDRIPAPMPPGVVFDVPFEVELGASAKELVYQ